MDLEYRNRSTSKVQQILKEMTLTQCVFGDSKDLIGFEVMAIPMHHRVTSSQSLFFTHFQHFLRTILQYNRTGARSRQRIAPFQRDSHCPIISIRRSSSSEVPTNVIILHVSSHVCPVIKKRCQLTCPDHSITRADSCFVYFVFTLHLQVVCRRVTQIIVMHMIGRSLCHPCLQRKGNYLSKL